MPPRVNKNAPVTATDLVDQSLRIAKKRLDKLETSKTLDPQDIYDLTAMMRVLAAVEKSRSVKADTADDISDMRLEDLETELKTLLANDNTV